MKTQFSISFSGTGTPKAGDTAARHPQQAFTLVEMMVTVALLAFIVVGLTTMFVQAQRAFRAGMNQTDVLESGRAMTDLITHQLEETVPAGQLTLTNFAVQFQNWSVNTMVGGAPGRTNIIDSVYFLTHSNRTTILNGYVVAMTNSAMSLANFGTLYYYQNAIYPFTNTPAATTVLISNAIVNFQNIVNTAVNNSGNNSTNRNNIDPSLIRVADGVVHFRILPYNNSGNLVMNTNGLGGYVNVAHTIYVATTNLPPAGENQICTFSSNAVPAYVDMELGVLESSTLATLTALPSLAQQQYLTSSMTTGRIHLFRRHITLSGVNPEAYP